MQSALARVSPGLFLKLLMRGTDASDAALFRQETALLRQLIFAAGDIAEIGYSEPDDVMKALDEAESKVFNVAEQRVTDSTRQIEELLPGTIAEY